MQAVERLQTDQALRDRLRADGMPWGAMNKIMEECIPPGITSDIRDLAYRKVKHDMDDAFGPRGKRGKLSRIPKRAQNGCVLRTERFVVPSLIKDRLSGLAVKQLD